MLLIRIPPPIHHHPKGRLRPPLFLSMQSHPQTRSPTTGEATIDSDLSQSSQPTRPQSQPQVPDSPLLEPTSVHLRPIQNWRRSSSSKTVKRVDSPSPPRHQASTSSPSFPPSSPSSSSSSSSSSSPQANQDLSNSVISYLSLPEQASHPPSPNKLPLHPRSDSSTSNDDSSSNSSRLDPPLPNQPSETTTTTTTIRLSTLNPKSSSESFLKQAKGSEMSPHEPTLPVQSQITGSLPPQPPPAAQADLSRDGIEDQEALRHSSPNAPRENDRENPPTVSSNPLPPSSSSSPQVDPSAPTQILPREKEDHQERQEQDRPSTSLTLSALSPNSGMTLSRRISLLSASLLINLGLPFVNGVMLGFGEIFARTVIAPALGLIQSPTSEQSTNGRDGRRPVVDVRKQESSSVGKRKG
ncbi:hypothetical protein IE53DRAFT_386390 [Violaceomyces palustris]|uniref:Uncharacterized protein n=1 Tax=Violaceomyces palustris TaxID=1673888 RepID=A0ACD0NZP2_9BASI|nr:hypothetical protein IE53DRAFT_386390 [Violaceomyces palustris]